MPSKNSQGKDDQMPKFENGYKFYPTIKNDITLDKTGPKNLFIMKHRQYSNATEKKLYDELQTKMSKRFFSIVY